MEKTSKAQLSKKIRKDLNTYCQSRFKKNGSVPSVGELLWYMECFHQIKIHPGNRNKITPVVQEIKKNNQRIIRRRKVLARNIAERIWGNDPYCEGKMELGTDLVFRWIMNDYVDLKSKTAIEKMVRLVRESVWIDQVHPDG